MAFSNAWWELIDTEGLVAKQAPLHTMSTLPWLPCRRDTDKTLWGRQSCAANVQFLHIAKEGDIQWPWVSERTSLLGILNGEDWRIFRGHTVCDIIAPPWRIFPFAYLCRALCFWSLSCSCGFAVHAECLFLDSDSSQPGRILRKKEFNFFLC